MSKEINNSEELVKSIDALLDEVFGSKEVTEGVEKSIDIAKDSSTKADDAVDQAPKAKKDEARGAGRPKQISEIPQMDMDGKRQGEYDESIVENKDKEDEPEETEQSEVMDQTVDKNRMASKPKKPSMVPFKKSEVEISEEELAEFLEFKKSKAQEKQVAEELRKAEQAKQEREELVKSAVELATEKLRKENQELKKSFEETQALIKAMASRPIQAKSITSIEALEKSVRETEKSVEAFSKSEILDAAFELAKSGKIPDSVVSEIEMTSRCSNPAARAAIEKFLSGK